MCLLASVDRKNTTKQSIRAAWRAAIKNGLGKPELEINDLVEWIRACGEWAKNKKEEEEDVSVTVEVKPTAPAPKAQGHGNFHRGKGGVSNASLRINDEVVLQLQQLTADPLTIGSGNMSSSS